MGYMVQLLPTEEQTKVLLSALKLYEEHESTGEDEELLAQEMRLEILKKRRESMGRGR